MSEGTQWTHNVLYNVNAVSYVALRLYKCHVPVRYIISECGLHVFSMKLRLDIS